MPGTYAQIILRIVFSTKGRAAMIKPDLQPRLYEFIGGIVRAERGVLYSIGGMSDHIHLLLRWRTDGTIADLMRDVKTRSSRWVHESLTGCKTFAWQVGYAVFSVSRSAEGEARAYIENQGVHHAKRDFMDGLIALLRAHNVEFDPRFVLS